MDAVPFVCTTDSVYIAASYFAETVSLYNPYKKEYKPKNWSDIQIQVVNVVILNQTK